MNFEWTDDVLEMRRGVISGLKRITQTADADTFLPGTREVHALLGEVGYWSRACSTKVDPELLAIDLALAGASTSLYLSIASTKTFAMLASRLGENDLLGAIKRGEIVGAVGFSEVEDSPCEALRAADGGLTVSGTKSRVSNSPVADWLAVFADRGKIIGFVEMGNGSVRVGEPVSTIGLDGLAVAAVHFEDTPCPSNLVVAEGAAQAAMEYRNVRDLSLAVAAVGLMERAIASTKHFAEQKKQDGKSLIAHQLVRFALAEMLTMQQAGELIVCRAAWALSVGDAEAQTLVRCAKVFCTESAEQVGIKAVEIAGAHGYTRGNEIERAYRDAVGTAVLGTANGVARIKIGDDLLARYA